MVAAGLGQVFARGSYLLLAAATGVAVFILSTVAVAALFGANVALIAYYFRVRRRFARQAGQVGAATSLGGLASGFFGIGCAACGTFVLSPVLSFIGAAGLIALLPFGGEEFGALGAAMLGFSLVLTARKIGEPVVCTLEPADEMKLRRPSRRPAGLFRRLAASLGATKSPRGLDRRQET